MSNSKSFIGHPPSGDEWIKSFTWFDDETDTDWDVYQVLKPETSEYKWNKFKLIACNPVPSKANYWIAWDALEKRLAGRDVVFLKEKRNALFVAFLQATSIQPLIVGDEIF